MTPWHSCPWHLGSAARGPGAGERARAMRTRARGPGLAASLNSSLNPQHGGVAALRAQARAPPGRARGTARRAAPGFSAHDQCLSHAPRAVTHPRHSTCGVQSRMRWERVVQQRATRAGGSGPGGRRRRLHRRRVKRRRGIARWRVQERKHGRASPLQSASAGGSDGATHLFLLRVLSCSS